MRNTCFYFVKIRLLGLISVETSARLSLILFLVFLFYFFLIKNKQTHKQKHIKHLLIYFYSLSSKIIMNKKRERKKI